MTTHSFFLIRQVYDRGQGKYVEARIDVAIDHDLLAKVLGSGLNNKSGITTRLNKAITAKVTRT